MDVKKKRGGIELLFDMFKVQIEQFVGQRGANAALATPFVRDAILGLREKLGPSGFANLIMPLAGILELKNWDPAVRWAGDDAFRKTVLRAADEVFDHLGISLANWSRSDGESAKDSPNPRRVDAALKKAVSRLDELTPLILLLSDEDRVLFWQWFSNADPELRRLFWRRGCHLQDKQVFSGFVRLSEADKKLLLESLPPGLIEKAMEHAGGVLADAREATDKTSSALARATARLDKWRQDVKARLRRRRARRTASGPKGESQ